MTSIAVARTEVRSSDEMAAGPTTPRGAIIALADPKTGSTLYLAWTRQGQPAWRDDPACAQRYASLADAQRVALTLRRRPGRPQPYAIPALTCAGLIRRA
jgi:hypothetical protein